MIYVKRSEIVQSEVYVESSLWGVEEFSQCLLWGSAREVYLGLGGHKSREAAGSREDLLAEAFCRHMSLGFRACVCCGGHVS